jgi:hypothetical protein
MINEILFLTATAEHKGDFTSCLMQSVAITIEDVSSYLDQGEVYNIM